MRREKTEISVMFLYDIPEMDIAEKDLETFKIDPDLVNGEEDLIDLVTNCLEETFGETFKIHEDFEIPYLADAVEECLYLKNIDTED